MDCFVLAIGFACCFSRVEVLEPEVIESQVRDFLLPVMVKNAEAREKFKCLCCWVSEDKGKSWKRHAEIPSTGTEFRFVANRDGLYWFTLQIVLKDGKAEPAEVDKVPPGLKVYVNSERRTLILPHVVGRPALPPPPIVEQPSVYGLQREVQELRLIVEQLRKRIEELEKDRLPK